MATSKVGQLGLFRRTGRQETEEGYVSYRTGILSDIPENELELLCVKCGKVKPRYLVRLRVCQACQKRDNKENKERILNKLFKGLRNCERCEDEKDHSRGAPYCKDCMNTLQNNMKNRGREIIREHKNVPCADCGIRYPYYMMDFDHRPDEEKIYTISRALTLTVDKLLIEIEKCDVVCANCHRKRTHERGYIYE